MYKSISRTFMGVWLFCCLCLSSFVYAGSLFDSPAPQPTAELRQATDSNAFSINSSQFGLNGPLSFGITRDNLFKYGANAQYTRGVTDNSAVSVLAEYAEDAYRVNGTFGFNLFPQGLLKFSAERLSEILPFYVSAGKVNQRVAQNAYGARYLHVLDGDVVQNIGMGAYYSRANDLTRPTILVAGGIARGFDLGSDLLLTDTTLLSGYVNYDNVYYHHAIDASKDSKGLGGSLGINQVLNNHFKIDANANVRKLYNTFLAGVHWLPSGFTGLGLEVSLVGERIIAHNGMSHENKYGLQFGFNPGQTKAGYCSEYQAKLNLPSSIKSWVSKPAVYMEQVLAVSMEPVAKVSPISSKVLSVTSTYFYLKDKLETQGAGVKFIAPLQLTVTGGVGGYTWELVSAEGAAYIQGDIGVYSDGLVQVISPAGTSTGSPHIRLVVKVTDSLGNNTTDDVYLDFGGSNNGTPISITSTSFSLLGKLGNDGSQGGGVRFLDPLPLLVATGGSGSYTWELISASGDYYHKGDVAVSPAGLVSTPTSTSGGSPHIYLFVKVTDNVFGRTATGLVDLVLIYPLDVNSYGPTIDPDVFSSVLTDVAYGYHCANGICSFSKPLVINTSASLGDSSVCGSGTWALLSLGTGDEEYFTITNTSFNSSLPVTAAINVRNGKQLEDKTYNFLAKYTSESCASIVGAITVSGGAGG